jgi:hypothetical protein
MSAAQALVSGYTFSAFVDYQMPRDKAQLQLQFSKYGLSELYYSSHEWVLDESCACIDQTPGTRSFLIVESTELGIDIQRERVISELGGSGFRPATHLEMYASRAVLLELCTNRTFIIALGSFAMYYGERCYALVGRTRGGDSMLEYYSDLGCPRWCLFVRKSLPPASS